MKKLFKKINNWIDSFEEYGEDSRVISYIAMRRAIGILGMSLPFILIIGSAVFYCCCQLMPSVSHYYHTGMRDVLVGILFFTALFLFTYRGYNILDRVTGFIAGIGALGVALFPTSLDPEVFGCTINCIDPPCWKTVVHFTSAAIFFILLAFISIFLFTRTKKDAKKENKTVKRNRNRIYRLCGVFILLSLVLTLLYKVWLKKQFPGLETLNPVFWLETIMLLSFGTSWLVKGQTIYKDKVKD